MPTIALYIHQFPIFLKSSSLRYCSSSVFSRSRCVTTLHRSWPFLTVLVKFSPFNFCWHCLVPFRLFKAPYGKSNGEKFYLNGHERWSVVTGTQRKREKNAGRTVYDMSKIKSINKKKFRLMICINKFHRIPHGECHIIFCVWCTTHKKVVSFNFVMHK